MPVAKQTVVSRILTEDVLALSDARKELYVITGRRPDKATVGRWIHRGVGGVKLEAVCLGRNLFTSRQALTRFIEARTAKALGGGKVSTPTFAESKDIDCQPLTKTKLGSSREPSRKTSTANLLPGAMSNAHKARTKKAFGSK